MLCSIGIGSWPELWVFTHAWISDNCTFGWIRFLVTILYHVQSVLNELNKWNAMPFLTVLLSLFARILEKNYVGDFCCTGREGDERGGKGWKVEGTGSLTANWISSWLVHNQFWIGQWTKPNWTMDWINQFSKHKLDKLALKRWIGL